MPEILIRHDWGLFDDSEHKQSFGLAVREIVARELHIDTVEGPNPKAANLNAADIEVRFEKNGAENIGSRALQIHIEAMAFPERIRTREHHIKFISMRIRENSYFPSGARVGVDAKCRPFVWLVLPEAAFEEL